MDFAQLDSHIAAEKRTAPAHKGDQCSMRKIYLNETDLSQCKRRGGLSVAMKVSASELR